MQNVLISTAAGVTATMAIGALWYSPVMLGKIWAQRVFGDKIPEKCPDKALLKTAIGNTGYVLAINSILRSGAAIDELQTAVVRGLQLSAVVCLIDVGHSVFGQKPLAVYLIDSGHNMACIVTATVILYLLK